MLTGLSFWNKKASWNIAFKKSIQLVIMIIKQCFFFKKKRIVNQLTWDRVQINCTWFYLILWFYLDLVLFQRREENLKYQRFVNLLFCSLQLISTLPRKASEYSLLQTNKKSLPRLTSKCNKHSALFVNTMSICYSRFYIYV